MFEFSEEEIASIFRFEEYSSVSLRILVWLLFDPEVTDDVFLCLSADGTAMFMYLPFRCEFLYLNWVQEEVVTRRRRIWNHEMWEQEQVKLSLCLIN
jgi:hypothetical protein